MIIFILIGDVIAPPMMHVPVPFLAPPVWPPVRYFHNEILNSSITTYNIIKHIYYLELL
jgi:hypothetical protein